jgi:hypothetical protein
MGNNQSLFLLGAEGCRDLSLYSRRLAPQPVSTHPRRRPANLGQHIQGMPDLRAPLLDRPCTEGRVRTRATCRKHVARPHLPPTAWLTFPMTCGS